MEGRTLEVDGSLFEGGGQIVRVSLCLAIIKGIPVTIRNIRAGRPNPGLARSHLSSVELLRDICNGELRGGHLSSTELTLIPGPISGGVYSVDCHSAGSISLIFQAILPVLYKTNSEVTIKGGTDVSHSPPTHFIENVLQPILARIGVNFDYSVKRFGFYPRGGGEVLLKIEPSESLAGIEIVESGGNPRYFGELLYCRNRKRRKGDIGDDEYLNRITKAAKNELGISGGRINVREADGLSRCVVNNFWAVTENGNILHNSDIESFNSKQNPKPEETVSKIASELEDQVNSGACVDNYLQDQLLIFLSMAKSPSVIKIHSLTQHSVAVINLITQVGLASISVEGNMMRIEPQNELSA
ncbi:unnamed protein product [Blepharisma stoltei]|uniref:RNA 3'-terminal-phosphate cyclase (ATP) n=1 Tax=Blepharisma stoltei TaxID=1481888 RepID=A0AAU9K5V9_9CILI|nr:unnamed protein product [Blepharisma stoltei]